MKTWALLFLASGALSAASISGSVGSELGPPTQTIDHPGDISYSAPGASATAEGSFGSVGAFANSNCGFMNDCSAFGVAGFTDILVIYGTGGTLQFDVGTTTMEEEGAAEADFNFGPLGGIALGNVLSGAPCFEAYAPCQINFDDAVEIHISGRALARASDFRPQDPNFGSTFANAGMSFSGLLVLDQNGNSLAGKGFRYASASGTDYQIAGGIFVTPEPALWPVVLIGLLAGAPRLRYCRATSRRRSNAAIDSR